MNIGRFEHDSTDHYRSQLIETASEEPKKFRSARRALANPLPSPQELLSDRIRGRVRYILDQVQKDSVILPTVLGHVLISEYSTEKEYRVALLWPHKKGRLSHDYVVNEQMLLDAGYDLALLIDGLVSAALKAVRSEGTGTAKRREKFFPAGLLS